MSNPMNETNPMEPNHPLCSARSKQTGEPCKNAPKPGWAVCRFHGAGGGRRPTKGGRFSRASKRFRRAYEAALDDAALLDLRPALAALDVRIADLLEKIDRGEDGILWRKRLFQLFQDVEAHAVGSPGFLEAMRRLGEHLAAGANRDEEWDYILRLVERRQVRTEKAIEAMFRGEQAINARELAIIFGRAIDIIADEIDDQEVAGRVLSRIEREVMGGPENLEQRSRKPWPN